MKFDPNKGLGKYSQGRKNPIKAIKVPYKGGLGFKPLLKHQFKKNKKRKVSRKSALHFVLASKLYESYNTQPTKLPTQTKPSEPNTKHSSIKPIMIPPPVINSHPVYHLEATPHIHMSSTKTSIPKVGECLTLNTSEHREDNATLLSLFSLLGNVREVLQSVIVSGELDLDETYPNRVIMLETWAPIDAVEQIRKANSIAVEDEDQVMD